VAAARWSGEDERKAEARRRVGRRRHMTGGAARVEGLEPEAEFLCGRRNRARRAGGWAVGPISRNDGERGWAVGKAGKQRTAAMDAVKPRNGQDCRLVAGARATRR
jgi:hypothetical protein